MAKTKKKTKQKNKKTAGTKIDPVKGLGNVIEQLEAQIGNLSPRSQQAKDLRKKRNKLKRQRREITAARFKKNTLIYKQATLNLQATINETEGALKNLKKFAQAIRVLSKLVLAAEQLILSAA